MKPLRAVSVAAWVLVVACVMACGSFRQGFQKGMQQAQDQQNLMQIGMAWHNYNAANNNQGPARAADLDKYLAGAGSEAAQELRSGKYQFYYGVGLRDVLPHGTGNVVLAHDPQAPTLGGLVLMADGSVRHVTATAFNAALKANALPKK